MSTLSAIAANLTTSVIERGRRLACEETSWTCKHIARWFDPDLRTRRDGCVRIPDGQRLWAWSGVRSSKKEKLIDSLIHGYPIPSCICNIVDRNNIRDFEVYDGRHRFETIKRFVNNEFRYQGKLYSELSEEDRERFDNRRIPVTLVEGATQNQLADVFLRLNSGAALRDSDMFWAYRETPLVKATKQLIYQNDRLKNALGGRDLTRRGDLANWVAHVFGLSRQDSGWMTTSFLRISHKDVNGLEEVPNEAFIREGLNALCALYERANVQHPVTAKVQKTFAKIGYVNAYFLEEWMTAASSERADVIEKWVGIIGALRSEDEEVSVPMKQALQITGAQNLNKDKILTVLRKLNRFLEGQAVDGFSAYDDDDSDD